MKGADSVKGEIHEKAVKCEREITDYGEEYKAQGLRRKCKWLRWETKGADSAKGRNKMHDG